VTNTQHSQEADIHDPGRIRTHDPSKRAVANPCLRPRGPLDRQSETWLTYCSKLNHTYSVDVLNPD